MPNIEWGGADHLNCGVCGKGPGHADDCPRAAPRTDGDDGELVERLRALAADRANDIRSTCVDYCSTKGCKCEDEAAEVLRQAEQDAARLTALSAEVERLRAVLGRFVDQARVGSGNKPVTRSSRVNCPSGIYHDARQALGAKP